VERYKKCFSLCFIGSTRLIVFPGIQHPGPGLNRNNGYGTREAKARKTLLRLQLQVDPSLTVPQHLIDRVDGDSEEGS
jgi:hypothetical protein